MGKREVLTVHTFSVLSRQRNAHSRAVFDYSFITIDTISLDQHKIIADFTTTADGAIGNFTTATRGLQVMVQY